MIGFVIGVLVGVVVVWFVVMIVMLEMVVFFNGFGGFVSLLVGWVVLYVLDGSVFMFIMIIFLILIGGLIFMGSIIVWGKFFEIMLF